MPHLRSRLAVSSLKKLAKLWPVIGVLGMRQVGKSTLLRELLGLTNLVTLDDEEARADAESASKLFLSKYSRPFVIDEVQKVPKLFDAIKSEVDRNRIPGLFYLTGSQRFSDGELTRESLTGRIATLRLYPLTLREAYPDEVLNLQHFVHGMQRGGIPVPMFLRDQGARKQYWDNWLETTLLRDLRRAYGKGYDLDFAYLLVEEISKMLREDIIPEVTHFSRDSRKVMKYLRAMESIFLLNRISCHPSGTGRDHWLLSDSGLAFYLMKEKGFSEASNLVLARHLIFNEISAHRSYQLKKDPIYYFKSPRAQPIDFVVDGIPIKLISKASGPLGWQEKGLLGAMNKLHSKRGFLAAPIERGDPMKRKGITRISWLHFS